MATLSPALQWMLPHEGGLVHDPADRGGKTNWGITQATLTAFNHRHPELGLPEDVADLKLDQAEIIYRLDYWRFDQVYDQRVATKLFDIAVNCGVSRAVKIAQKAANGLGASLEVDGVLGTQTLSALNAAWPDSLLDALCRSQEAHYRAICERDPSQLRFIKGWTKRAKAVPPVEVS